MNRVLDDRDPQLGALIKAELERQRQGLELIASENFTSLAVMAASGSVLTNKYAEGYPDHRYYGGCEIVDQVESLDIGRARKIYQAEHVNVQPHSGSQANMAAYFAVSQPGDVFLGMDLSHGGHLTHGSPVSFSGRMYQVHSYGVCQDTELIDYDDLMRKAAELKPKVIVAGASAYPRVIDFAKFRQAADIAGAALVVDMAHYAGLVAAGLYPSPVEAADIVTSTTHKTLRGPRGGLVLSKSTLAKKVDAQVFPGIQGGPLMQTIAAKAVAFGEALTAEFMDYQQQVLVNAKRLASNLADAGFRLVSGGTSTHMLLVDLRPKGLTGLVAEKALDRAGITTNKNAIPFDTENFKVTSGLRLGTPAITTRGMKESEMDQVSEFIVEVLRTPDDDARLKKVRRQVECFAQKFPLYPELG
ncbi:serine hydroxymethyltransferase [Deltaproteobacteria bacterium OttesenSCG-928-M10]|nr:serine hydroxymethyltransferase [Deltaproteobacteria bacterium OttesenSCG-928-M10]